MAARRSASWSMPCSARSGPKSRARPPRRSQRLCCTTWATCWHPGATRPSRTTCTSTWPSRSCGACCPTRCWSPSACPWMPSATCAPWSRGTGTRCHLHRSTAWCCRAGLSRQKRRCSLRPSPSRRRPSACAAMTTMPRCRGWSRPRWAATWPWCSVWGQFRRRLPLRLNSPRWPRQQPRDQAEAAPARQPPLSPFTQPRSSGRSSNSVFRTTVLVVRATPGIALIW